MKYLSKFTFFIFLTFTSFSFSDDTQFELEANKLSYNNEKNEIIANGNAKAWDTKGRKIYADKIIYNKKYKTILAYGNSKYNDTKILITAKEFKYNLIQKQIEAKHDVSVKDYNKNTYSFSKLTYNEIDQLSMGHDVFAKINDGSTFRSKYLKIDHLKELSYFSEADYTACKKINNKANEYCPSWSLNSKKITHNKKLKKVTHTNSLIKIKNIPVFYTPYFSHPDPSVKRQSGFLSPVMQSVSNLGRSLKVPYFFAISDDKNLTLTPVYFFQQKNMINASYKQAIKNGFLQIESSYSGGYNNIKKENNTLDNSLGSRNYFFLKYEKKLTQDIISDSTINFNLQRVSQKNYLRLNNLNTSLFKDDIRVLRNNLNYTKITDTKSLEIGTSILENLDLDDKNKYTYIFPEGSYSVYNKLNENFNTKFSSNYSFKKYLEIQKQGKLINNFTFNSKQFFNKFGIGSRFALDILNTNTYNNNIPEEKGNLNFNNYFTILSDSSLPLIKNSFQSKITQTITPRLYLKYTSGNTINNTNNSKILEINDIFSLNRSNNINKPETGFSLGQGIDYSFKKQKIDNSLKIKSNFGIGQVFKFKRDDQMPSQSSLQNRTSDFVGFANYTYYGYKNNFFKNKNEIIENLNQNNFNFNYKFNLANDLKKFPRNIIDISTVYNQYSAKLSFDESNTYIGSNRLLTSEISKYLNENYYLNIQNTRDLISNATRNQKFSFNFENDCLITSLSISRDFYTDDELSSNKSILFNVTFKPFGDSIAPDLTGLLK